MPIYAYKCSACQHQIDVLQRISDAPLTLCPQCGAPALAKQLTAAGFQLKGSGWYATDFKHSGGEAKPAAKPGDAAAPAGAPGKDAAQGKDAAPGKDAPAGQDAPAPAKDGASAKPAAAPKDVPAPAGTGTGTAH